VFCWTHTALFAQQHILTVGWAVLAGVTALQTTLMALRTFRPTHCLRGQRVRPLHPASTND